MLQTDMQNRVTNKQNCSDELRILKIFEDFFLSWAIVAFMVFGSSISCVYEYVMATL